MLLNLQSLDEFKKLGKVITGREQSDAETLEQMRRADKDRNALLRCASLDRPRPARLRCPLAHAYAFLLSGRCMLCVTA